MRSLRPLGPGHAVFDGTGHYRYLLTRQWLPFGPPIVFLMLNPSTADAGVDDPTVHRASAFAQRWGFGGLHVLNIFAYRSTAPQVLKSVKDPVGPDNDAYLRKITAEVPLIVAAWGTWGALHKRGAAVLALLHDRTLHCLGVNEDGSPVHPLYIPNATTPRPYAHDGRVAPDGLPHRPEVPAR